MWDHQSAKSLPPGTKLLPDGIFAAKNGKFRAKALTGCPEFTIV
jgi:hypothetical protein